jgi:hypothetical protein
MLIPIAGEFLAMSCEQFEEARRRGREIIPPSSTGTAPAAPEEILDAEGMEKRTGIPASWWLENARRGSIPHLRAGKYVRFALTDAITFLKTSGRPAVTLSSANQHTTPNSTPYAKRPRSATGSGSGVAARIKSVSE